MADRRSRSKGKRKTHATAPTAGTTPAVLGESAHGWTILGHDLLLDQLDRLANTSAEEHRRSHGASGPATKLLAHVLDLIVDKVPRDPANQAYRHGGALAGSHREWFRAKTGGGRYRLFFRFHSKLRVIVFAWLNDEHTLRSYGSKRDAYVVFSGMLDAGNPPGTWDALLASVNRGGEHSAAPQLEAATIGSAASAMSVFTASNAWTGSTNSPAQRRLAGKSTRRTGTPCKVPKMLHEALPCTSPPQSRGRSPLCTHPTSARHASGH